MLKWLNDLRYARFNSVIARKILGLIYREQQIYPILWGPTRGMRVRFHPAMNYHAILGLWERESTEAVTTIINILKQQYPHTPLVVADVGANLGMYTLLLAKLLKEQGHVYAFEPAPDVVETLQTNTESNGLQNVTIVPKACSDRTGTMPFYMGWHHHASSLNAQWAAGEAGQTYAIEVPTISLDDYFEAQGKSFPHFIKMDIEGGAVYALKGCSRTANLIRPAIYIESHTPEEDRAICDFIAFHNYVAYRLTNRQWVANLATTHPDLEGVWGNLLLFPQEQADRYRSVFV
jgi:FkbM family methyltransferase